MGNNIRNRNIKVIAETNKEHNGFNIYLDFSGQREYLVFHRQNGLLYAILKDGIALDDIRRWRHPRVVSKRRTVKNRSKKMCNVINHLIVVIDEYMIEREAC